MKKNEAESPEKKTFTWHQKGIAHGNGLEFGLPLWVLRSQVDNPYRLFLLVEQMESVIVRKGLKQIYKGFYETGELRYQFALLVTDYKAAKSDHLRKKDVEDIILPINQTTG